MRVVSGIHSSRKLFGYDEKGIRPTMDKVKESLFAMINSYLKDSICLDLFAGTGALGIEAISNNSKHVYFVDNSKNSINVINKNIESLNLKDNLTIINDNYTKSLQHFCDNNITFDIIFVDPPYGVIKIEEIINKIIKYNVLNKDGIIVCEYENENLKEQYGEIKLLKTREYGSTHINIYKN